VEQLCLPHSTVAEICRVAHNICHQGIKRTKEKIRSHFFWNNMSKTITEFINHCHECQLKLTFMAFMDRIPISVIP